MNTLRQKIQEIDNKVSSKYSVLFGTYNDHGNIFRIRNIQGSAAKTADAEYVIPLEKFIRGRFAFAGDADLTAAEDHILREIHYLFYEYNTQKFGGSKSYWDKGALMIYRPDQRILKRSLAQIIDEQVVIKFEIALPLKQETIESGKMLSATRAQVAVRKGRTQNRGLVNAKFAMKMICSDLPEIMDRFISTFDIDQFINAVNLNRDQRFIRTYLKKNGFVSFIADGSNLPRKGKTDFKVGGGNIVPFESPESMRLTIPLPDGGSISGMGLKQGVTLIVGGGYHGKSTLLSAIEHGAYDHIDGDGREYVITDDSVMNISADDGRCVKNVDISMFLNNLPTKTDTKHFSTETASGSTSQAASVVEAIEAGCKLILIDEDRSANNFMTRDARMQRLVPNDPITPYLDRVREIYLAAGASSILVIGGSGDYLDVADNVIMMDAFHAKNVTPSVRVICRDFENRRQNNSLPYGKWIQSRRIFERSLTPYADGKERLEFKSGNIVQFGTDTINLDNLLTCPTPGQMCAVLLMLRYIHGWLSAEQLDIASTLRKLFGAIREKGVDILAVPTISYLSVYEMIRPVELVAIINRVRSIKIR